MSVKLERSDFRGVERVEVKRRSPAGGYDWKPGKVRELAGKGAYVDLDDGNTNFFYYSEIRIPHEPRPRAVPSLGTLADAKRGQLRAVPSPSAPPAPRPKDSTPPEQTATPSKSDPWPDRAATQGEAQAAGGGREPLPKAAAVQPAQKRPKHTRAHNPTAIGNLFRAYRLREQVSQYHLAGVLEVSPNTLSVIELGDTKPNDELLQRFATLSGTPLSELRRTRDGEPSAASAPPQQVAAPDPEQVDAPPPEPPSSEPSPAAVPSTPAQPRDGFEDYVDALDQAAPMPRDREARRRWFQLARELFDLSRAE